MFCLLSWKPIQVIWHGKVNESADDSFGRGEMTKTEGSFPVLLKTAAANYHHQMAEWRATLMIRWNLTSAKVVGARGRVSQWGPSHDGLKDCELLKGIGESAIHMPPAQGST